MTNLGNFTTHHTIYGNPTLVIGPAASVQPLLPCLSPNYRKPSAAPRCPLPQLRIPISCFSSSSTSSNVHYHFRFSTPPSKQTHTHYLFPPLPVRSFLPDRVECHRDRCLRSCNSHLLQLSFSSPLGPLPVRHAQVHRPSCRAPSLAPFPCSLPPRCSSPARLPVLIPSSPR